MDPPRKRDHQEIQERIQDLVMKGTKKLRIDPSTSGEQMADDVKRPIPDLQMLRQRIIDERERAEDHRGSERHTSDTSTRGPEILDPEKPNFRACHKQITVDCLVRTNHDESREVGSLHPPTNKSKYHTKITIDFGRFGTPSLCFILRTSAKSEVRLGVGGHTRLYHQADFLMAPGVEVGTLSDGQKRFELQLLSWDHIRPEENGEGDDRDRLHDSGRLKTFKDDEMLALTPDVCRRLIMLELSADSWRTMRSFDHDINSFLRNFPSKGEEDAVHDLFFSKNLDIQVRFLIPEEMGLSAKVFGDTILNGLINAVEKRFEPCHQYTKDGKPDLSIDMRASNTYANRFLAMYTHEQESKIQQELRETGTASWPSDPMIYGFPKTLHFGSPNEFVIHVGGAAVRAEQATRGEYLRLQDVDINFKAVKTTRYGIARDVDPESAQGLQQRALYLYGKVPKTQHKLKQVPQQGARFEVEFPSRNGDEVFHQEKSARWNCFCHDLTAEEATAVGGADFLFVGIKSASGTFLRAADTLDTFDASRHTHIGRMYQVFDDTTIDRQLAAVNDFVDLKRYDLRDLQSSFLFENQPGHKITVDLTKGPVGDIPSQDKDGNSHSYQICLNWMLEDFTLGHAELALLKDAPKQVHDKVQIYLGGPGCKKTTTAVKQAILLCMVGHKILVVAKRNNAVDKFARSLEEFRQTWLDHLNRRYTDATDEAVRESITEMYRALGALQFARFAPVSMERKGLARDETFDGPMYEAKSHHSDKDTELDTRFERWMADYAIWLRVQETAATVDEGIAQRGQQAAERLYALEKDYRRLPIQPGRTFEYPIEMAMPHKVDLVRRKNKEERLEDDWTGVGNAVKGYDHALLAVVNQKSHIDNETRKENRQNLRAAENSVLSGILGKQNLVTTTYVNAGHEILQESFGPTIVYHEEASRTDLSTSLIALVINHVSCHIIMGDVQQMPPFDGAAQFNEFREISKMSLLCWVIEKRYNYQTFKLLRQFRGRPSCVRFFNEQFYDGGLENAENTLQGNDNGAALKRVMIDLFRGNNASTLFDEEYYLVNVVNGIAMNEQHGTSLENYSNAEVIARIIKGLLKANVPAHLITVLCYYAGQLKVVRKKLRECGMAGTQVMLATVDSYQGEDNEIILVDFVATGHDGSGNDFEHNPESRVCADITEHVKNPKRLCVALSRSKQACVGIGQFFHLFSMMHHSLSKTRVGSARAAQGRGLYEMIWDAFQRNLVIHDWTIDSNPRVRQVYGTQTARTQQAQFNTMRNNLAWMADRRLGQLDNQKPKKYGSATMRQVTYAGPDQGKAISAIPPYMRDTVMSRRAALMDNPMAGPVRTAEQIMQDPQAPPPIQPPHRTPRNRKPCAFHWGPKGCRSGDKCKFSHEAADRNVGTELFR